MLKSKATNALNTSVVTIVAMILVAPMAAGAGISTPPAIIGAGVGVDLDGGVTGGTAYARCDGLGTVCAAAAASAGNGCAKANGAVSVFDTAIDICANWGAAVTLANAIMVAHAFVEGAAAVEFTPHPPPSEPDCAWWNPFCWGSDQKSTATNMVEWAGGTEVVDSDDCADLRSLPRSTPLTSMASCSASASKISGAGCFTAEAEAHGQNGFEATPPPAEGTGCDAPETLLAQQAQGRELLRVDVIPAASLDPETLANLAAVLTSDAASRFDAMTATWGPELESVKQELRAKFIEAVEDSVERGDVLVAEWRAS